MSKNIDWKQIFATELKAETAENEPCSSWKVKYCLKGDTQGAISVYINGETKTFQDLLTVATASCRQSAEATKQQAEEMRNQVAEISPEVAMCMVPPCVFRGGCPNTDTSCKLYDFLCQTDNRFFRTDLVGRYEAYDEWRKTRKV